MAKMTTSSVKGEQKDMSSVLVAISRAAEHSLNIPAFEFLLDDLTKCP